jgi:uncharacterized protein (TIGR02246 family)
VAPAGRRAEAHAGGRAASGGGGGVGRGTCDALHIEVNTGRVKANAVRVEPDTSQVEVHTDRIDFNTGQVEVDMVRIEVNTEKIEANTVCIKVNTRKVEIDPVRIGLNTSQVEVNTVHSDLNTDEVEVYALHVEPNTSHVEVIASRLDAGSGYGKLDAARHHVRLTREEDLMMRTLSISLRQGLYALAALLGFLVAIPLASAAEPAAASPEEQVAAILRAQADAWNRGDLEAFTSVYAEDAAFLSPSGLTHGRREVLERYRKRYPDKAAMGKLDLDVIEARTFPAGKTAEAVSVVARWRLEYPRQAERKTAEGLTLLVLRRVGGGVWEIVQDASM